MKITLCQLNPVVGDIDGNADCLCRAVQERSASECDLFIFSELFLQGYPPRDLLEREWFIRRSMSAIERIKELSVSVPDTAILFGTLMPICRGPGKPLANAALLVKDGRILLEQHKTLLPTYDIFDETRYFQPASSITTVRLGGETLGVTICEDAWNDPRLTLPRLYDRDPVGELVSAGATILINISASPFYSGKEHVRRSIMQGHSERHSIPMIFVNQVGGNDELVFDGGSMVFNGDGAPCGHLPRFEEAFFSLDTRRLGAIVDNGEHEDVDGSIASVHDALVLGVRDYVRKCGFSKALLGLSGGIDSAVTAAIAARALGSGNVWGVTMPSRYSSEGSVDDSAVLAANLGIRFSRIPIENVFSSLLSSLEPFFAGLEPDIAEENLQARVRGTLLMALSNKFGALLLSTGNKSELAVGYGTLYGDMNGGLCVISDLPKARVYELAGYINREKEIIPVSTITKAPSAELRPDQKDQDSLPPYPVLDAILEMLVEEGESCDTIVQKGFDPQTVKWVARAVARSEYKRRQAPTGLKVTPKAFGSGRRFPIAARYDWS